MFGKISVLVLIFGSIAWGPATIEAAVTSLPASKDNTIYDNASGDLSNGAGDFFYTGINGSRGGNITLRSLIAFDTSGIPSGSTVTSAVLRLHVSTRNSNTGNVSVHRLNSAWGEGASHASGGAGGEAGGAAAQTGDATWVNTFFNTATWTNAGGDFAAAPSATVNVPGTGVFVSFDSAGLISDVQAWVDNPAGNVGWLLKRDTESGAAIQFDSRTHATTANRPVLIVGYDEPAPAAPALGKIRLTAKLNGGQENPVATTSDTGEGLFSYDYATRTLTYRIVHTTSNATAAHIHGPAREGTNANVIVGLSTPVNPLVGTVTLNAAQECDLFDGLYYVNIHSSHFPSGAIRGQILATATFAAELDGDQESPGVNTDAIGAANLWYNRSTRTLSWSITHTVDNPTAVHIHGAARPGASASPMLNLGAAASPIQGQAVIDSITEAALFKEWTYINIHSGTHGAGEIRGQIQVVDCIPDPTHTACLDSIQQTEGITNAFMGAAFLSWDRAHTTLYYRIVHDVAGVTAAHIHGPADRGQNAGVVHNLGIAESPIIGSVALTHAQAWDLLSGKYYLNVHSSTFPSGAIRGQIETRDTHACVLEGRQEVPPISSKAQGIGVFYYDAGARTLDYKLVHSLDNATAAHIHGPAVPGKSAGVRYGLGAGASPITGRVALASADVHALLRGELYVNVHSPTHGSGEIRGQIVAVDAGFHQTHAAKLEGSQEVGAVATSNSGLAVLGYDPATRVLRARVNHSISNVTAAHIHGPAGVGTNAGVVFAFTLPVSPIDECFVLSAAQQAALLAGRYYINVHSAAHASGELRGQILPDFRVTSDLKASQTGARTTSAHSGLVVAQYDRASRRLTYCVEHSITNVTAAHIHGPALPGFNANVVAGLGDPMSPITGAVTLTEAQDIELLSGKYYVNVHSTKFPAGEIRGQLRETMHDSDGNDIDDHWERDRGLTPGGYDASLDGDGDGVSTRDEYIADTDPLDSNDVFRATSLGVASPATLTFASSALREYGVETKTDLMDADWQVFTNAISGSGDPVSVVDTNEALNRRFYRINVKLPALP